VIRGAHVLDVFIASSAWISNNTNGPGVDTGDILCRGLHAAGRGARMPSRPSRLDFL